MKFTLEVELDYIDEEGNLDDAIKQSVISSAKDIVLKKLTSHVDDVAIASIKERAIEIVNEKIHETINSILAENRVVTDDFGREKKQFNLEQMLIDMIDGAIKTKALSEYGEKANGHNAKYSLFEWMSKSNIEKAVSLKVEQMAKQTQAHIEQLVSDKIKTQVADKLTAMIMDNSSTLSLKS